MTRALLILVPSVLGISLAAATFAQTTKSPSSKCGVETWSTDKMTYEGVPCTGGQEAQPSSPGQAANKPAAAPCGVETWSTDKMTYVTSPCANTQN